MKGVILAAGKGTRLRPITYVLPKPLIPVLSTPVVEIMLGELAACGVKEVLLITRYKEAEIKRALGRGERFGLAIEYTTQGEAKGTGAAARLAREFVGESNFFLSFADLYVSPGNYKRLFEAYEQFERPDLLLSVYEVDDPCHGAAVYEKEGRVEQVVEKPAPGTSRTNWMNAGLFVAKPSLFDYLDQLEPSERGEYELPDAFNRLIEEGRRVYAAPLEGVWSDLGRPSQVLWTDGEVMKYDKRLCTLPEPNALVHISPEAHVGPCRFEGIVAVAQKAEVEAGCTLANVAILGETYIETHSELRNCLVAPGAYIRSGERHIGSPEEPAIVMPTGDGPW